MTPERWNEVQALFEATLAQEPADRSAFLKNACNGDDELLREVASLLDADGQDHVLLDGHALEVLDVKEFSLEDPLEGAKIGPYRLLHKIGEGGMGLVYQAERADGVFEQRVALKLIKRGMDTTQIVRRFEAERQILARLQHEHIARLFDGGVTDDGLPYFVMEYVDGMPIDAYCDAHRLTIDERLDLFVTVCKAVLYAHASLVVHRDLKPENILVTRDGKVKLLDFGIAKVLGDSENQTQITQAGKQVLTPAYASPEQMRGEMIGTSSDIYSLGVVLYELLAGQRPYDQTGPEKPAEPEGPSTRIDRAMRDADTSTAETISRARATRPEKLRRRLSGDLDVICLKALRQEAERRYGSVEAFSDDVRRHRAGLPVLARPDTAAYLVRKFIQRHRAGVAAALAVLLVTASLVGFYTIRLSQERDRAQLEAEKANQVSAFLQGIFEVANPSTSQGETVTARELLDNGAARLQDDLADQPDVQAAMYDVVGNVYSELGLYEKADSIYRQALAVKEQLFGQQHLEVASTLNLLGITRRRMGDYAAADSSYRAALAIQQALLGGEHEDIAESLANLAVVLRNMGNDEEAEAMVRESLRQRLILLGPNHIEVAATMNNLALILTTRDALEEADSLYGDVTKILQNTVGDVHPGVASTLNNRAYIQNELGNIEEAVALYSEALDVKRKLYGSNHPSLVITLNNLASALIGQQKYHEAEGYLREAMAIGEEALGREHPEPANTLSHMAKILAARQDYAGAEALRREAIAIERAVYGAQHRRIAASLYGIASLLSDQDKHEEAEKTAREGLAMDRAVSGEQHPDVARDLRGLGDILKRAGRYEEAETELLAALSIGEENEQQRTTLTRLVALYEAWGRPEQAQEYRARLEEATR